MLIALWAICRTVLYQHIFSCTGIQLSAWDLLSSEEEKEEEGKSRESTIKIYARVPISDETIQWSFVFQLRNQHMAFLVFPPEKPFPVASHKATASFSTAFFYHKWRFSVLNFTRIKMSALNGIKALLHSYRFPLRPHEIYELIQVSDVKHKTRASSLSSKWISFN